MSEHIYIYAENLNYFHAILLNSSTAVCRNNRSFVKPAFDTVVLPYICMLMCCIADDYENEMHFEIILLNALNYHI